MRVLGIETSCDETGVAVYDSELGIVAHTLHSQIAAHAKYGGVVPELASRDHIRYLIPLLQEVGAKEDNIDAIAYTKGPGLIGALMVGASFAKALGYAWKVPTLGIHHMEGHLMAAFLDPIQPIYPFLALLVSGGHTQLIAAKEFGSYQILGDTLDDAAGEAFDKTAKLLGLAYPGGPLLAKLAEQGTPGNYNLPRPMLDRPGLDFSFSGLKTQALYAIRDKNLSEQEQANLACDFEDAIVDTLVKKSIRALEQTNLKTLVVAGGVSANKKLRVKLQEFAKKNNINIFYPELQFCTDNGAMIAYAGYERLRRKIYDQDLAICPRPRWPLTD